MKPRGLIDTLGTGFALVARRPLLLVLPILLDGLLRYAPGISAASLLSRLADWVAEWSLKWSGAPDQAATMVSEIQASGERLAQVNVLGLLTWQVPTLRGPLAQLQGQGIWASMEQVTGLVIVGAVLTVAGLALGAVFYAGLANAVRSEGMTSALVRRVLRGWLWLAVYRLLQGGALIVGGLVIAVLLGVAALVGDLAVALVAAAVAAAVFLVAFHLFFVEGAIFLSEVPPVQAIRQSVTVVSRNFWPCLGLWSLTLIVGLGMRLLWGRLGGPSGTAVALVGHAIVATGLIAAVMGFYQDRWQQQQTAKGARRD
ncbi:MAG: hypothetical protein HY683_08500 [Chloroflexi bacterium]|nr:hypothetical protein [Chloroflexota bacterium]